MQANRNPTKRSISLMAVALLYACILLGALLAACTVVPPPVAAPDQTVEALSVEVDSARNAVGTVQTQVNALSTQVVSNSLNTNTALAAAAQAIMCTSATCAAATSSATPTVTPPVPGQLIDAGVALTYTEQLSYRISFFPVSNLKVYRSWDNFQSTWMTPTATIELVLAETSPGADRYNLLAVESLPVGTPGAWREYSAHVLESAPQRAISSTQLILGQPFYITATITYPAPEPPEIGASVDQVLSSGVDKSLIRRMLVLDRSGPTPMYVLVVIDPSAPAGVIDRVCTWCTSSCGSGICSEVCKRIC
jgi:hypothetical protein